MTDHSRFVASESTERTRDPEGSEIALVIVVELLGLAAIVALVVLAAQRGI